MRWRIESLQRERHGRRFVLPPLALYAQVAVAGVGLTQPGGADASPIGGFFQCELSLVHVPHDQQTVAAALGGALYRALPFCVWAQLQNGVQACIGKARLPGAVQMLAVRGVCRKAFIF